MNYVLRQVADRTPISGLALEAGFLRISEVHINHDVIYQIVALE